MELTLFPLFSKLLVLLGLPVLMCGAFKWLLSTSFSTFIIVFSMSVGLILTGHSLSDTEMPPPHRGFL